MATAYKSMHAYGNHYRVRSSEQALRTANSGVAATFRQVCRNGIRDLNQVNADVEYVGHIEEILELNYRRHCLVVLVCDFVKANYIGENATIKKEKWSFTLANYKRRYGNICCDNFAFPIHCEQVFYSEATEAPGWRVVLRKEVRGKRVLPNNGEDVEAQLFEMGADEDFHGLRPEREVGEEQIPAAPIGENVILEPVRRPRRQLRRGAVQVNEQRVRSRQRRGGSHLQQGQEGRSILEDESNQSSNERDERHEEEDFQRNNLPSGNERPARGRRPTENHALRRVRQRRDPQESADSSRKSSMQGSGSNSLLSTTSSGSTTNSSSQARILKLFIS